jgi:Flp pilus assembly protein CpaB
MGSIRKSTILAGLLWLALCSIHCKGDRNKGGEAVEGSGTAARPDGRTSLSQAVRRRGRAVQVKLLGAGSSQAGDHLDLVAVFTDPKTDLPVAVTLLQDVFLLERDGDRASLMVLPEEAEILTLSEKLCQVWAVLRNPQDMGIQEDRIRTTLSALVRGGPPPPEPQLVPPTGPSLDALPPGQRALEITAQGSAGVDPGDRVDLLALLPDGGNDDQMVTTVLEDVPVLARSGDRLVLSIGADLAERTVMAASVGKLSVSRRAPASRHHISGWLPATKEHLITGTTKSRMQSLRQTALQGIGGLADLARLPDPLRVITLSVDGASTVTPGDRLDLLASFVDPKTNQMVTLTLLDNVITLGASGDQLTLVVMPLEAQMVVLAGAIGQLKASLRNPEDTTIQEGSSRATIETLITGERIKALHVKRGATIQVIRMPGQRWPQRA